MNWLNSLQNNYMFAKKELSVHLYIERKEYNKKSN